ncbi:MAG: hypothetical protein ACI89X_001050 [Planctomycetota bacterium]|jgi:hypothetical protein
MRPSGGIATRTLVIPNQTNLVGFQLTAQTPVLGPPANAFGFINSNGVLLAIDNWFERSLTEAWQRQRTCLAWRQVVVTN